MKTHGLLITNERSNAYRTKLISSPITTTKPSLLLWRVAFWAVDISGNRCTPTRDEGIPQCTATSHSYGGFHCYLWGNTGPFIICSLANGALSRGIGAPYRCMHSSSTTRVSQWCKTSSNDPRPHCETRTIEADFSGTRKIVPPRARIIFHRRVVRIVGARPTLWFVTSDTGRLACFPNARQMSNATCVFFLWIGRIVGSKNSISSN